jgi:hypothetical protein
MLDLVHSMVDDAYGMGGGDSSSMAATDNGGSSIRVVGVMTRVVVGSCVRSSDPILFDAQHMHS